MSDYADLDRQRLSPADIHVGDAVTPMDVELTHTMIAATAIATRDWMPVHHDKDYAQDFHLLGICRSTMTPMIVAVAGRSASRKAKLARGKRAIAR